MPTPKNEAQTEAEPIDAEPMPQDAGVHKTLRLILQELRGQRGMSEDGSPAVLVAMALQALAVVCLLGGLWMGGDNDGLFFRWFGVALIAQLGTIAVLLFAHGGRG